MHGDIERFLFSNNNAMCMTVDFCHTGVNVASHSTSPLHNTLQVPTGSVAGENA